jgi:hypothetical protein
MRKVSRILRLEGGVMGRQAVVQITCDRCTRVEHRPMSEAKEPPAQGKKHYAFVAVYKGKKVEFEDLCTACEEILDNHWEAMARELKKASPRRSRKKDK